MNKKILLLSPLLGSLIATILMVAYAGIKTSVGINGIFALLQMIPVTFLILSLISYFFSLPIGWLLINRKEYYLWSDGLFVFLAFLLGLIIGAFFSIINYQLENSIFKAFFVFTSATMGATFNASFYIALNKMFIVDKNHE